VFDQFFVPRLIAAAIILLVSFPVHEFSHAFAAYRLGDGTAKLFGRLTLNPVAHFDPMGGILLLVTSLLGVGIGWAKPTPVNPANLNGGRNGDAIVAAAGPASNLVLASLGGFVYRLLDQLNVNVPYEVEIILAYFILINIALMLFNFLPIPPLDGSHVLFALMSPRAAFQWRATLQQYGFLVLLFVVFFPIGPGGNTIFGIVFNEIGFPLVNLLAGREIFG
jgi:Zn-dependent protease